MDKVARLQKRFNQFAMVHPLEALREEDVMMGSSIAGSSVTEDGSGKALGRLKYLLDVACVVLSVRNMSNRCHVPIGCDNFNTCTSSSSELSITWYVNVEISDAGDESIMSLRQAVREAALAHSFPSQEISIDRYGHPSTEHYFTPIAQNNSNRIFEDKKVDVVFGKQRRPVSTVPRTMSVQPSVDISWKATEDLKRSIKPDSNKDSLLQKIDRPASPPLLMELSTFDDTYDDLLGTLFLIPIFVVDVQWCFSLMGSACACLFLILGESSMTRIVIRRTLGSDLASMSTKSAGDLY